MEALQARCKQCKRGNSGFGFYHSWNIRESCAGVPLDPKMRFERVESYIRGKDMHYSQLAYRKLIYWKSLWRR
jgi:hypothetical protein